MAMIFPDIESGMASQLKFAADARDDGLLVVTEERSAFFAIYEKKADRPELVLVRRSPTADHELLAAALPAVLKTARELGWIVLGTYRGTGPIRRIDFGRLPSIH